MKLVDWFLQWVNERGSAQVLRERLALSQEELAVTKERLALATLRAENAEARVRDLESQLQKCESEVTLLKQHHSQSPKFFPRRPRALDGW